MVSNWACGISWNGVILRVYNLLEWCKHEKENVSDVLCIRA